ncbi:hypothetical protein D9619_008292 [Psilocybe cf. subviscida]|uniref:Uncharacterized protein n=1 Tax=Psilocybe cf. subviscida TaxID=2480587 RepID=A0A8H5F173_9AGAR|nr:hypothetical protein D9619_008292 [Psilocybe cf. subviscida]
MYVAGELPGHTLDECERPRGGLRRGWCEGFTEFMPVGHIAGAKVNIIVEAANNSISVFIYSERLRVSGELSVEGHENDDTARITPNARTTVSVIQAGLDRGLRLLT